MKLDLNQALEQLALAFDTTVDKLYPMLIKQAYITAATEIILATICWIGVYLLYKATDKWVKKECRRDWSDAVGGVITIAVVGFVGIIATICVICDVPTIILNPEYWAIKEILNQVSSNK